MDYERNLFRIEQKVKSSSKKKRVTFMQSSDGEEEDEDKSIRHADGRVIND